MKSTKRMISMLLAVCMVFRIAFANGSIFSVRAEPPAATGVTFAKVNYTLDEGKAETLVPTVTPEGAEYEITYVSDNENVAKVVDGALTAVGSGTTTITAIPDIDGVQPTTLTVNVRKVLLEDDFRDYADGAMPTGWANKYEYTPEESAEITYSTNVVAEAENKALRVWAKAAAPGLDPTKALFARYSFAETDNVILEYKA